MENPRGRCPCTCSCTCGGPAPPASRNRILSDVPASSLQGAFRLRQSKIGEGRINSHRSEVDIKQNSPSLWEDSEPAGQLTQGRKPSRCGKQDKPSGCGNRGRKPSGWGTRLGTQKALKDVAPKALWTRHTKPSGRGTHALRKRHTTPSGRRRHVWSSRNFKKALAAQPGCKEFLDGNGPGVNLDAVADSVKQDLPGVNYSPWAPSRTRSSQVSPASTAAPGRCRGHGQASQEAYASTPVWRPAEQTSFCGRILTGFLMRPAFGYVSQYNLSTIFVKCT